MGEMTFDFQTYWDAERFEEIYADVCSRRERTVTFDDVPEALVEEVLRDARRYHGCEAVGASAPVIVDICPGCGKPCHATEGNEDGYHAACIPLAAVKS